MTLLRVSDLVVSYPDSETAAVLDLSFTVKRSESVGIVGESGAGKSQTALAIMGLLPGNAAIGGSILLAGNEVVGAKAAKLRKLRARKVSMVFQDPATALNPYLQVGDQLKHILLEHRLIARSGAKKKCIEMLERVGLPEPRHQYHAYPHQLSGGMRQRVLIAAALIGEPELIVADEATTALDVTVQAQILALLQELRRASNTALLMISHDLAVIAQNCERLLVMDQGRLVEEGACSEVFSQPADPHTAKLLASVSRLDARAPVPRSTTEAARKVLSVKQLGVSFRARRRGAGGEFVAVQPLDLSIDAGEAIAIVGESGSGKTSIARAIAGLLQRTRGSVTFLGEPLRWRVETRPKAVRRRLQMVFQEPLSSLNPAMRVGRIIAEPLAVHSPGSGSSEVAKRVADMLVRVGLEQELSERYPHELSGGQAQRVAIARALILEPRLLICDEALSALDGTVRREIIALLQAEQERSQLSLMIITHDLGVVREICDRVIVMYQGEVCEQGRNEDIFAAAQHPYTRALLAAVPVIEVDREIRS
jgi:ABC-type glutathione transport system ATPase component